MAEAAQTSKEVPKINEKKKKRKIVIIFSPIF